VGHEEAIDMTDPIDPRHDDATAVAQPDDGTRAQPESTAPAAPAAIDASPVDDADESLPSPEELAAALETVTRERDTYLDHLRRERAEFENYRKRSARELTEASSRGAETLITQMLSVLDNFGYVLEAAKDHDDAVAKGVRIVHAELRDVLARAGLEDVPGVGAPFDPTWHDAVMQVEGETTEDGEPVVAQVLRTGYRFRGRVLRPASVAVTQ
jgi:molecular chaperone GrpE